MFLEKISLKQWMKCYVQSRLYFITVNDPFFFVVSIETFFEHANSLFALQPVASLTVLDHINRIPISKSYIFHSIQNIVPELHDLLSAL